MIIVAMGAVRDRLDSILTDFGAFLEKNDRYGLSKYADISAERFLIVDKADPENDAAAAYVRDRDEIHIPRSMLSKTLLAGAKKGNKLYRIPLDKEDREEFEREWRGIAKMNIMHEIAHRVGEKSGLLREGMNDPITASTHVLDREHSLPFVLLSLEFGGRLSNYVYLKEEERIADLHIDYEGSSKPSERIYQLFKTLSEDWSGERSASDNLLLLDLRGLHMDYPALVKELSNEKFKNFGLDNIGRKNGIMFVSDDDGVLVSYMGKFYVSKLAYNNGVLSVVHREIGA